MPDYPRLNRLAAELRERLDQLDQELAHLRQAGADRGVPRSVGAGGDRSLADIFDLSKVIPPTASLDPDAIVGGAPTNQFPDCCAVGDASGYFCTGTLIAPKVVVTAKHCTGASRVFLKGRDVGKPATGETIDARAIPHPNPQVDLQVLVLERSSQVTPRRIARGAEVQANVATLVGFGTIDFDGTVGFGQKRKVRVPITSVDCATQEAQGRFGCRQGIEMVAGHRGLNKDSCRGDSGGPLYVSGVEGGFLLLGVTSRGTSDSQQVCGDGGIYVRVDQFIEWIREQTGADI